VRHERIGLGQIPHRALAHEIDERLAQAQGRHRRDVSLARIETHTEDIDDEPIRWLSAPGDGPPVLYVHGVPDAADMWLPFLERTGGIAVDLPGFGRSAKRGDFDYSIAGYDAWLERFLDHVGVERFRLCVHDWGVVALALAQRAPERVERLVVINAVPFLPGYRWHRWARIWRTRALGELAMGATTKWAMRRMASVPEDVIERWWRDFDQGTQRAILQLYRSAPEDALAAAGLRLGAVTAPALVLWGDEDPYLAPSFADAYAEALPGAQVRHVSGAGHWPWLDDPGVTDQVCRFLTG
jgi:pimeloyl-ACP methyl ester carboxylesterase